MSGSPGPAERIQRIEVRGVTRAFGATLALRGVNVAFDAGTISLLEGPNGAGKSTLLAVVGTVVRPNSGSVWYDPVGDDPEEVRRHLGWVAHDSHCYRELGARENVLLAARLHGLGERSLWNEVAARVDILHLAERPVGTLSRGQKQRVALARALVHSPSVLLLDEPWTGLDQKSAGLLEQVLRDERDRGSLIVVVSHGEGVAERLGARRVRIDGGRIAN
ncbi:MAG: ABC transporter ATP-binding protein [Myxococcota bacterium]|jgi:heme exporter protein A|nr:ABC transporter ATP-binding protein [Myxococcota bacterium]